MMVIIPPLSGTLQERRDSKESARFNPDTNWDKPQATVCSKVLNITINYPTVKAHSKTHLTAIEYEDCWVKRLLCKLDSLSSMPRPE